MKLSSIKGDRVFDVIADLIDPIASIAADEGAAALFRREKLPEGQTAKDFLLQRARRSLPPLLRGHKGDLIAILAAIEGVPPAAYAGALDMVKLVGDFIDLFTDEAFEELFISAQSRTTSGSAPANTAAPAG